MIFYILPTGISTKLISFCCRLLFRGFFNGICLLQLITNSFSKGRLSPWLLLWHYKTALFFKIFFVRVCMCRGILSCYIVLFLLFYFQFSAVYTSLQNIAIWISTYIKNFRWGKKIITPYLATNSLLTYYKQIKFK